MEPSPTRPGASSSPARDGKAPDPSAPIKRYLANEARSAIDAAAKASESLVDASQVSVGTQHTTRRLLQTEHRIDNTATLVQQLEKAAVELDATISKMVSSVTKLEDVADQLAAVSEECNKLYAVMNKGAQPMQELNKLLAQARAKKAQHHAQSGAPPTFNLENPYSTEWPWLRWDLADIFAYTETAALAGAERGFRASLKAAGLGSWTQASREERKHFVAATVEALKQGYTPELADNLLYALRATDFADAAALAEATQTARDVLGCEGAYLAIAGAVCSVKDPNACLSILLMVLTLCPGDAALAEQLLHVPVDAKSAEPAPLLDVLLAMLPRLSERSVTQRKTALLVWRVAVYSWGSPEAIDERKRSVRQANQLPAKPGLKSRRADVEDMRRRLERLHCGATAPAALDEAMALLERSLHVPASVLREADQCLGHRSRVLRKVIGSELKKSVEHGPQNAPPRPVMDGGQRRCFARKLVMPFEHFYRRALPQLHAHVLALVRALVAALMQTSEGPAGLSHVDQLDWRRHNAVVAKATSSTLLLLLRLARENHPMQCEYLMCIYVDCNLFQILLQFVQMDVSGLCLQPYWMPNAAIHYLFQEPEERPHVNWNFLVTTVSCMQLMQKLTKHSLLRVRELLRTKTDRQLKALMLCHPTVRHYALKILKSTFRLIKVKRRTSEGPLITAIYMELPNDLNDDWLTSFYLEQDDALLVAEERVHESETRDEVAKFNAFHYPSNAASLRLEYRYADEDEEDAGGAASLLEQFNRLCGSITVGPQDFDGLSVDAWLEREVFAKQHLRRDPFLDPVRKYVM